MAVARDLHPVAPDPARPALPGLDAALDGTGPALLLLPPGPEGERLRGTFTRAVADGVRLDASGAVLLGGSSIPTALLLRARASGTRVVRTYGMTETCGGCVYDGRPLPGVTVEVVEGGHLAPAPGQGLIRLAGPMLA